MAREGVPRLHPRAGLPVGPWERALCARLLSPEPGAGGREPVPLPRMECVCGAEHPDPTAVSSECLLTRVGRGAPRG